MPLSATVVGALLGLGTQMYSNALRKLPYMRRMYPSLSLSNHSSISRLFFDFISAFCIRQFSILDASVFVCWNFQFADPWEHVLGMGIGAVFANQMVKWEVKAQEDLDKLLLKAKEANERRYFGNFYFYRFCQLFNWALFLFTLFLGNFRSL